MAISPLSLPTLIGGTTTGYPGYVNAIKNKINELATAMNVTNLTLTAILNQGSPAGDLNTLVSKVNELVGAYNAGASPVSSAPSLTSFTPAAGAAGTSVTLTGTNLTAASAASIGGVAAPITSNTATSLTLTVPNGAATGKVSLTTSGGTVTSASNFTVTTAAATNQVTMALVSGQSNAVGSQSTGDKTGVPPLSTLSPPITRTFPRVLLWHPQLGNWQNLHIYEGIEGSQDNGPTFGPEIGIAQDWEERNPTDMLYLVKDARGGEPIEWFMKGDASGRYDVFKNLQVGAAVANLVAAGKTVKKQYMFWSQGEANGGQDGYQAKLAAYFSDLVADGVIDATTLQLISECKADPVHVAPAQRAYVAATPAARLIVTANYKLEPDNLHYTQVTQFLCGYVDIPNAGFGLNRQYPFGFAGESVLPALAIPANLRVTGVTNTSIAYAWDAAQNAQGYIFQYGTDAGITQNVVTNNAQTTRTFLISNLAAGTSIFAHVLALGNNTSTSNSAYSGTVNAQTTVPAVTDHTIEETDPRWNLYATYGWTYAAFGGDGLGPGGPSGENVKYSGAPDATGTIGFTGTQIKFNWAPHGSNATIEVLINGNLVGEFSNGQPQGTRVLYSTPVVPAGQNILLFRQKAGAGGYIILDETTCVGGDFYAV